MNNLWISCLDYAVVKIYFLVISNSYHKELKENNAGGFIHQQQVSEVSFHCPFDSLFERANFFLIQVAVIAYDNNQGYNNGGFQQEQQQQQPGYTFA